jgi:hypothetical protein
MADYRIYPKQFKNEKVLLNKNSCFIVMQFSSDLQGVYRALKTGLDRIGVICKRADEVNGTTVLFGKIMQEILGSRFIIADMTYANSNVFYELGIAHSFKDPDNVILIKQKEAKCPSDITYLEYIDYTLDDLDSLVNKISEKIKNIKFLTEFYDALNYREIIPYISNDQEYFIEFLKSELGTNIGVVTELLNNNSLSGYGDEIIEIILINFKQMINKIIKERKNELLKGVLSTYYEILLSCSASPITETYVIKFLEQEFDFSNSIAWKIELVVKLTENRKLLNISLPWIMNYFSQLHATNIDLNRYSLEKLLMTSTYKEVNDAITQALFSENCYLREYMADIAGEKRLKEALDSMYMKIESESNVYVARSMVEAIGKIDDVNGCSRLLNWFSKSYESFIERGYKGIFAHMSMALARMDTSKEKIYFNQFRKQYSNFLTE